MRLLSRRREAAIQAVAAGVEARLREQFDGLERMQATMTEVLLATRADLERRESDLARRESDLVRVWDLVAESCERTIESIAAQGLERQAVLGALRELVAAVTTSRVVETTEPSPPGSHVLGGAVFATDERH